LIRLCECLRTSVLERGVVREEEATMATVQTRLMTAEEFYEWVNRPENRGRVFELLRGEVVEMPSPGKYHGFVCGNISRILGVYACEKETGSVCTNDSGLIVKRAPDTVRGPDVSFYVDDQTADTMDRKYAARPPVLVAEVLSPHDKPGDLLRRLDQYLQFGISLVWVVDPEGRFLTAYQPDKMQKIFDEEDELTAEDVLPEFRCRVADFFAVPRKPS
jgi:Uma2 family endonuclease